MVYTPDFYDPKAAKAKQRGRQYWLTLLAGLFNIALIVLHPFSADNVLLSSWCAGCVSGSLIVAGIKGRTDSYYQDLVAFGMRCSIFVLGVFVLLLFLDESSLFERLIPGFVDTFSGDAYLLTLVLGLFFHAGYAFAYLRDLLATGDRE